MLCAYSRCKSPFSYVGNFYKNIFLSIKSNYELNYDDL